MPRRYFRVRTRLQVAAEVPPLWCAVTQTVYFLWAFSPMIFAWVAVVRVLFLPALTRYDWAAVTGDQLALRDRTFGVTRRPCGAAGGRVTDGAVGVTAGLVANAPVPTLVMAATRNW